MFNAVTGSVVAHTAHAAFVTLGQAAQKAAGGLAFRTGGGKIDAMEASAPKCVAIIE